MSFAVRHEESSQTLQWLITGKNLLAAGLKLKLPEELSCKSVMSEHSEWQKRLSRFVVIVANKLSNPVYLVDAVKNIL
jgi:hypothetical protein